MTDFRIARMSSEQTDELNNLLSKKRELILAQKAAYERKDEKERQSLQKKGEQIYLEIEELIGSLDLPEIPKPTKLKISCRRDHVN